MKNNRLIFALICIVFFTTLYLSLCSGSISFSLRELFNPTSSANQIIFWELRLPRTLTALTCGGLLALAGMMMQLLLQNPLADPYILGISSGAGFTTLALIALGFADLAFPWGTWLGSLLAMGLILGLCPAHRFNNQSLLLIGVALAAGFSAAMSFLLLLSNNATVHSMLFWLTGDLNTASYPWLEMGMLGFTLCLLMSCTPGLNLLLRGELEAQSLGLSVTAYKILLFVLSALCTASAVALAGAVGFVGLIIPHLSRYCVGYNHRLLIPTVVLLGSSLMLGADTLARTLLAPQQLPVGILITAIGVPVFVWMVKACRP